MEAFITPKPWLYSTSVLIFPDPVCDECMVDKSLSHMVPTLRSDIIVCLVLRFLLEQKSIAGRELFLPVGNGEEEIGPLAKIVFGLLRMVCKAVPNLPASLFSANPLVLHPELPCPLYHLCACARRAFSALEGTVSCSHPGSGPIDFHLQHSSGLSQWVSLALLGSGCHRSQRGPIRN